MSNLEIQRTYEFRLLICPAREVSVTHNIVINVKGENKQYMYPRTLTRPNCVPQREAERQQVFNLVNELDIVSQAKESDRLFLIFSEAVYARTTNNWKMILDKSDNEADLII